MLHPHPSPSPSPSPSQHPSVLEITVLSAEGLHHHSSLFTALFPTTNTTPFITLTKIPPTQGHHKPPHVYTSKLPTWDHKFRVPLDSTFFTDRYSSLHLQLHTKRRIVGQAQLGWCLIPASDIGLLPPGSIRFLSYRLRAKDGSRGHGIINLSIQLKGLVPSVDACQTVIGMPVTAVRGMESGREEVNSGGTRQRDSKKPLRDLDKRKLG